MWFRHQSFIYLWKLLLFALFFSVMELLYQNGISFHGYNGGGLDGRNSNKVLKKLNDLNIFVTENCPEYLPVVGLLFKFEQVVFVCFGMNL